MTPSALIEAADRMWEAAWALDRLRGDRVAYEWTGRQVADLLQEGRADDPATIRRLANVLEEELNETEIAGPAGGPGGAIGTDTPTPAGARGPDPGLEAPPAHLTDQDEDRG